MDRRQRGRHPLTGLPMPLTRPLRAALCLVLGALVLLAGALLSDAARLLEPDAFADRMAASLADERVAAVAAEQVTEGVLAGNRDLTALRPLILAASRDAVASSAFRGVVRTAVRRAHAAVFSRVGRSLVLSVPDVEVVLRSALAGSPDAAAAIPETVRLGVANLSGHPAVPAALAVMDSGRLLGRFAPVALLLGGALLVVGIVLMPDRRDGLVGAGAALIAAGIALWAVVPVGEHVVARVADDRAMGDALAGLWAAAVAGLPGWGLTLGAVGVVLAAAGSSLLERLDFPELARRGRLLLIVEPRSRRLQALRGIGFTAAGLLVVFAPRAALAVLAVLAGLVLAFEGLRELFASVLHAAPAHQRFGRAVAESGEGWAVGVVLVGLLAATFAGGVALATRSTADERVPTTIDACNGAAALCDRRLDEVALAGTHNSMASADVPGWLFPQQERDVAAQLEDGIRALLVDVYEGVPVGGRVRTALGEGALLVAAGRVLGPEGMAAAMRIRDRLVGEEADGPPGLYLCHGLCEVGALPADSVLRAVRDFLVQHPNEVVVVMVEDYVAPARLAAAFERSGLAELAFRGPAPARWPTLRELIARDERVVVLLESGRPGVPWLLPAFAVLQETPYTFTNAADTLSCAPNRGGTAGSLFLLNHWIETTPAPRPSNAAVVNATERLLQRARRCAEARGRPPNILAVDFYRTGGVIEAVRRLNGLDGGARRGRR